MACFSFVGITSWSETIYIYIFAWACFRATFVQDYRMFWERVDEDVIPPPTTTAPPPTTAASTTKPTTATSIIKPTTTISTKVPRTTSTTKQSKQTAKPIPTIPKVDLIDCFLKFYRHFLRIFSHLEILIHFSKKPIKYVCM